MHLLFDARLLHRPMSGLERVQTNLLRELATRREVRRLRLVILAGTKLPAALGRDFETVEVDGTEGILRLLLAEPASERPDLYHLTWFPDRTPRDLWLPIAAKASVVEVHDAILNRHPEYHPDHATWAWYDAFVRQLVRSCDRLLVHSQSVAKEAVRDLGADERLIHVAPLAVDPALAEPLPDAELRQRLARLDLGGDWFVAIGKDYPHKDHGTLFRALATLPDSVHLVCAGSKVWHRPGETSDELLRALRIEHRVRWVQGLPDEDIKALIQGARALVYPSREEGFGLPPLEAMAVGTLAIASRATSMPGVCGDGAWLFEPGHAAELAGLMRKAVAGGAEADAQRARGRVRVATFSWKRCADFTLECYRAALGASRAQPRVRPVLTPDFEGALQVIARAPFSDGSELRAWQERCLAAELHARALEGRDHPLRQRLELGANTAHHPVAGAVDGAARYRRFSLRRRWGKIVQRLRHRGGSNSR